MADKKNNTNPGDAPQNNEGTQSVENAQTVAGAPAGDGTETDNHPNPARAASDAAEAAAEADAEVAKGPATRKAAPKVSDVLAKAASMLLKSNPTLKAVYMTADGTGFATKNDAENHAHNLENKVVLPVNR